jgi:hypothetical protein
MTTRRKIEKQQPTLLTLSQRQHRALIVCFTLASAAAIWIGFGFSSVLASAENWRVSLVGLPLLAIQLILMVLLFQFMRQEMRQVKQREREAQEERYRFLFVDETTGEAFTPVGERMEV